MSMSTTVVTCEALTRRSAPTLWVMTSLSSLQETESILRMTRSISTSIWRTTRTSAIAHAWAVSTDSMAGTTRSSVDTGDGDVIPTDIMAGMTPGTILGITVGMILGITAGMTGIGIPHGIIPLIITMAPDIIMVDMSIPMPPSVRTIQAEDMPFQQDVDIRPLIMATLEAGGSQAAADLLQCRQARAAAPPILTTLRPTGQDSVATAPQLRHVLLLATGRIPQGPAAHHPIAVPLIAARLPEAAPIVAAEAASAAVAVARAVASAAVAARVAAVVLEAAEAAVLVDAGKIHHACYS